jgi:hypothetical protein
VNRHRNFQPCKGFGSFKIFFNGIENGHILLLSDFISNEKVSLTGIDGYNSAIATLDGKCEPYGQGYGAVDARCIKTEDINNLFGFNPSDPCNNGKPSSYNHDFAYGTNVTYTGLGNGQHSYSSDNPILGSGIDTSYTNGITKFTKIDGNTLNENEEYRATMTYYSYAIRKRAPYENVSLHKFQPSDWDEGFSEVRTNDKIFNMFHDVFDGISDKYYFLATPTVWANQRVSWGLMELYCQDDYQVDVRRQHYLWNATKGAGTCEHYVRAVVYLDPGVSLTNKNASGEWIIQF